MYTDTTTQAPQTRHLQFMQNKRCQSAPVLYNAQYICICTAMVLHKSQLQMYYINCRFKTIELHFGRVTYAVQ